MHIRIRWMRYLGSLFPSFYRWIGSICSPGRLLQQFTLRSRPRPRRHVPTPPPTHPFPALHHPRQLRTPRAKIGQIFCADMPGTRARFIAQCCLLPNSRQRVLGYSHMHSGHSPTPSAVRRACPHPPQYSPVGFRCSNPEYRTESRSPRQTSAVPTNARAPASLARRNRSCTTTISTPRTAWICWGYSAARGTMLRLVEILRVLECGASRGRDDAGPACRAGASQLVRRRR